MSGSPSLARLVLKKEIDEESAQTAGKNRALADTQRSLEEFNAKRAMIGETQLRVIEAALQYGAITIAFDSPYEFPGKITREQAALSLAYNFRWVTMLRIQDFDILDIGIDRNRTGTISAWYIMELTAVRGYYKHSIIRWD